MSTPLATDAEGDHIPVRKRADRQRWVGVPSMQWVFLVLALSALLAELHTGTFYLAGVAAAALLTTLLGFWVHDEWLIVVFLLLSIVLITLVIVSRRRLPRGKALADFDIGQIVTVDSVAPGNRVTVTYRGTRWQATMDGGAVPEPGDIAVITRKTDKLLHLALPSKGGKT